MKTDNDQTKLEVLTSIWSEIVEQLKPFDLHTARCIRLEIVQNNKHGMVRYPNLPADNQIGKIGPTNNNDAMYQSYVDYTHDTQGYHTDEFAEKLVEIAHANLLWRVIVPTRIRKFAEQSAANHKPTTGGVVD